MLLDLSPHNSHSWFQFSCAVSADIIVHKQKTTTCCYLTSSFIASSSLTKLPKHCPRPQQANVGMWRASERWLIVPKSVRSHKWISGGSEDPSRFQSGLRLQPLLQCELGGVKVCICRAVRQRWGQISTSTGLISPVLFSRTHSSLSLHGSTHCRSLSTGSIVWTKKEQPSVKVSDKPAHVFCLPRLRWCIMLESDSAQVLSSRERNLAAFNVQHIYYMLIVHSKKHLLQSA